MVCTSREESLNPQTTSVPAKGWVKRSPKWSENLGVVIVKKYVLPKYAKPVGNGVLIIKIPSLPVAKSDGWCGPMSQIVVNKHAEYLPLHRQMQRFERSRLKLSSFKLTDWVSSTCSLLKSLYEALKEKVIESS
jgi:transposase